MLFRRCKRAGDISRISNQCHLNGSIPKNYPKKQNFTLDKYILDGYNNKANSVDSREHMAA